jgi:hypothetical protein
MGTFSGTFLSNAQIAAKMMKGTLYEAYYGIPYEKVAALRSERELNAMCIKERSWDVAANGQAIEKCMIITTHNLALVFSLFDLKNKLEVILPELCRKVSLLFCSRACAWRACVPVCVGVRVEE